MSPLIPRLRSPIPNTQHPTPALTLVTGGARSGKSSFAERLAARGRAPVLYLATATVEDREMRVRVDRHRAERPPEWQTLEVSTGLGAALTGESVGVGTVLLEDLGFLVSNLLLDVTGGAEPTPETAERLETAVARELEALDRARVVLGWDLVIVTNEVGLGLVPVQPLGRIFRDALGRANQAVARQAQLVYLLVSGIPIRIKPGLP